MKKILLVFLLIFITSCVSNNSEPEVANVNIIKNEKQETLQTQNIKNISIQAADTLFSEKKYKEAIEMYEMLLEKEETNSKMLHNLFTAYVTVGMFEKAVGVINFFIYSSNQSEYITGFPIEKNNLSKNIVSLNKIISDESERNDKNLIQYAELLYEAGDYYYEYDKDKYYYAILLQYMIAFLVLEDAEAINPENSEIYYLKGRLLMDINGDFEGAERFLRKATSMKKDDFRYFYRLGNAYMHQNKNILAKEAFTNGIKLNDKYEKLHLNLGNIMFRLWDKSSGYNHYNNGLKVCSKMCDSFYSNIGNQKQIEGKKQEALDNYLKAVEVNPNHKSAKENMILLQKEFGVQ